MVLKCKKEKAFGQSPDLCYSFDLLMGDEVPRNPDEDGAPPLLTIIASLFKKKKKSIG